MLASSVFVFFTVQALAKYSDAARILGVFPIPSISHQVVFRALTFELAKRGHEMVVITPNPALPKTTKIENITEIDSGYSYQVMERLLKENAGKGTLKRGVVLDQNSILSEESTRGILSLITHQFDLPEVKNLINNSKKHKFDLILAEGMTNFHLIMSHFFKAPVIMISSFYGCAEHLAMMGAVAWHPIYYPNYHRKKFRNLTLWDHIAGVYLEWQLYKKTIRSEEIENELLKERFGDGVPTVEEMKKNVQMLFLNAHPLFSQNRPVPPSIVHLGALHLQPVKPLPEDLQSYLDNSSRGVIYVSFGTNVRTSMMDSDLFDEILQAFEMLPYDILWKCDGSKSQRLSPKNLRTEKWFPQRDLLMHPNIKLFIMQGGLQSTDEAIDAAVPVLGMPMLGDQWFNVDKCVELGFAEQLDVLTVTASDIVREATKLIENPTYRENARRVRSIMRNYTESSLERAVRWTEHVLQHGGGEHLKSPAPGALVFIYNCAMSHYTVVTFLVTIFLLIASHYIIK